jgi:hypothetical protein
MRDSTTRLLEEAYKRVLEADTEQLATPQGREIKGVFVPTEIENWINNVMYRSVYDKSISKKRNKKADLDYTPAELKRIVDIIYNKWKDKSKEEVQRALDDKQPIDATLAQARQAERMTPEQKKAKNIKGHDQIRNNLLSAKQAFNAGNLQTTNPLFRSLIVLVLKYARQRARKKNLPFFYSTDFATQLSPSKEREEAIDYIISIWPKDNICPATGVKFNLTPGGAEDNTPELDRIIPERGYVKGNVAIISRLANRMKRNGNLNDVDKIYEYSKKGTEVLKEIKNHLNGYNEEIDNPLVPYTKYGQLKYEQRLQRTSKIVHKRAKRKSLPFNINSEYLRNIFPVKSAMICPVLGTPLSWFNGLDNYPSLDRIVPELGYVKGNVCYISNKANVMKSNATTEQIKGIRDWLERSTQSKAK